MTARSSLLLMLLAAISFISMAGCAATRNALLSPEMLDVEIALKPLATKIEAERPDRRTIEYWMKAYLREYPQVYGIAYAPVPAGASALYVHRTARGLRSTRLAPPSYDYAGMDWYTTPVAADEPSWSDPYFDSDGGGDIWMRTYSIPLRSETGAIFGVLTSDLPSSPDA